MTKSDLSCGVSDVRDSSQLTMAYLNDGIGGTENLEASRIQRVYAERDKAHRSDSGKPGRQRNLRERDITLERLLRGTMGRPLSDCRVLDVGCGRGGLLSWFNVRGVTADNLYGIDLSPQRIKIAREAFPDFNFAEGSAERIEFSDETFDIVAAFTMFSSILDHVMAKRVAQSMIRVLKRDGVVAWHDMRYPNPANRNVRAMTRSRIREFFPLFELQLEPIYLLPPIASRLGRTTEWTYPMLTSIPALRSHYCGLLRQPRRIPVDTTDGPPSLTAEGTSQHA